MEADLGCSPAPSRPSCAATALQKTLPWRVLKALWTNFVLNYMASAFMILEFKGGPSAAAGSSTGAVFFGLSFFYPGGRVFSFF